MTELEFYKNWCSVILDYQYEDTILSCKSRNNFEELREDYTNLFNDMRYRLLEDCKKARMVNVKRWFSSLNEGLPEPGDPDYPILDARLLAACGKGLDDLFKKRWERIAKIKERGKLRSDSEFYLINEHMDYLINMGAPDEETELFDSMLFDYEERARKRREKREKQKKDKS